MQGRGLRKPFPEVDTEECVYSVARHVEARFQKGVFRPQFALCEGTAAASSHLSWKQRAWAPDLTPFTLHGPRP